MKGRITGLLCLVAWSMVSCHPRYGFDVVNETGQAIRVETNRIQPNENAPPPKNPPYGRADVAAGGRMRWRVAPGWPSGHGVYMIRAMPLGVGEPVTEAGYTYAKERPTVFVVRVVERRWAIETLAKE